MNTKKLLPLILVAPILASCGGNSRKINDVKFESYSNKVEYDAFTSAYKEAKRFYDNGEELSGYVFDLTEQKDITKTVKRNNSEISSINNFTTDKANGGYDKTNKTYTSIQNYEEESSEKNLNGELKENYNVNYNQAIQETTIDEVNYLISVDISMKYYSVDGKVDEKTNIQYIAKQILILATEGTLTMINSFNSYDSLKQDEKDRFSFYQDNNVFTVVYAADYDEPEDSNLDGQSHVTSNETWQIVFNDTGIKAARKYSYENTITFNKDTKYSGDEYFKNDVYTNKVERAATLEIKFGEYTQAPVDITNYANKGSSFQ